MTIQEKLQEEIDIYNSVKRQMIAACFPIDSDSLVWESEGEFNDKLLRHGEEVGRVPMNFSVKRGKVVGGVSFYPLFDPVSILYLTQFLSSI